jgi:pseudaminic acid cytidylyltransferase
MKIAAVIPARGGSKRIPRKNIKAFAGRPMVSYAISVALESGLFDLVAVSSDDDEILDLACSLGAFVLRRPAELADDFTPTVPVIAHAIHALEPDHGALHPVCCIYPAVPLLRSSDIAEAKALLDSTDAPYAFPIVEFPTAIQRALRLDSDRALSPFFPEFTETRTQDLPPAYHDAGQFYWGRRDAWLSQLSIHKNGRGLIVPSWRAVDLDTPDDWRRAELMQRVLAASGDDV